MFEHQLMTNLAFIALISIKINWFPQKILSKYHRKNVQNLWCTHLVPFRSLCTGSIFFGSESDNIIYLLFSFRSIRQGVHGDHVVLIGIVKRKWVYNLCNFSLDHDPNSMLRKSIIVCTLTWFFEEKKCWIFF